MTRIHLRLIGWIAVLFGSWALFLLLLQGLFGRQVDRLQVVRLGRELALQVRLTELTLERYPPTLIQELTGLDLVVVERPASRPNPSLVQQEHQHVLRQALCERLRECPVIVPADQRDPAVWIELISPLEPVWLRAPLPRSLGWPPQPMLLAVAGVAAALSTAGLVLAVDVERPLRRLERALSVVRFMVRKGVSSERLAATGYGEFQPIATGNTNADRQKNRRIELKLTQAVRAE